jgi:hypothetical protein
MIYKMIFFLKDNKIACNMQFTKSKQGLFTVVCGANRYQGDSEMSCLNQAGYGDYAKNADIIIISAFCDKKRQFVNEVL